MSRSEDMENQKNVDNHPITTSEQNMPSKVVAFSGKLITFIDHEHSNEEAREESIPLGKDAESREDHDVKVDDKNGEKKEDNDMKDAEKNEESGEKKQSSDTDGKQNRCENVAKADDKKEEKKEDETGDNDSENMEENKEQADITDSVINPLKNEDYEEESDSCGIKCLTFVVECCNCTIM